MKKLQIILLGLFILGIGGCDFLKYDETSTYSKEDVFSNLSRTKQFLTNIYSHVPQGFNNVGSSMRAAGSDNAEEIDDFDIIQRFNDGTWSANQTLDSQWGNSYDAIRAANRFLKEFNIDNFNDRQYNDSYPQDIQQAKLFPYQARFLRAYFYFNLTKRYGGVPLIKKPIGIEQANNVKSSGYAEVTTFIVNELNDIIPKLPVEYKSLPGHETGRVTRGAAMALKARVLLYAASPLHNESAKQQPWIEAAQAAKALIDSSYYSLANNYNDAFNNITSNELIWGRRQSSSTTFEESNFPIGYEGVSDPGIAPTQNLVDSYEMQTTGMGINEPNSGYDPSHPYQDRDPRLNNTVIVNGSKWKGRTVEIWNGGLDGPPKVDATETGYYLKKYVIESISLDPNNTTPDRHTWVIFRYGEVLLNYAEAMNEAYGPDNPAGMGMSARDAVNMIRNRVNMPDFPVGMSKSAFRKKLHNERRVELAFENHRFWDIRRWKIGPQTTDIEGMKITKNSDGSFTYNRKRVEQRSWSKRMYLYPIPQNEVYINNNLKQNPGW